ncbi:MAG TPA: GntR family transcriptional regulator [Steroidobacteraceae bacterium]|nr:GntR family transcriptional regulator [Steroidobacteraceae bacterium]
MEFAKVLIEPAYRKVAAAIGERILSRSLREGERLPPETELARQFGVNRSTVREALRELESRGLLQRRPGSKLMSVSRPQHATVAQGVSHALLLHDVTVQHLWEALTLLEPPLAQAAARAHSAADLEALTSAIGAFGAAADTAETVECTAEVFRCIARATHNPVLGLAQEPLLQLLEPSLRIMIDKVPQARTRIATAHRRLREALEARDESAAHDWMARHIRDFRKGYEIAGIELALRLMGTKCDAGRAGGSSGT